MYKNSLYHLVSNLEDSELEELVILIADEKTRRAVERAELRRRWVDRQLKRYDQLDGAHKRIGNTIVVAISSMGPAQIGIATLVKGDTFDRKIGIAVAFAKAIGETIPDYI